MSYRHRHKRRGALVRCYSAFVTRVEVLDDGLESGRAADAAACKAASPLPAGGLSRSVSPPQRYAEKVRGHCKGLGLECYVRHHIE